MASSAERAYRGRLTAPIEAVTETGPDLVGTTSSRTAARKRSAATLVSSTVQFFRIRPNLLPEKRPSTWPARRVARIRGRHFCDHSVGDVETECVIDAGQMIDTDQHEGAGGTEARYLL